jgi:hypothetical protein
MIGNQPADANNRHRSGPAPVRHGRRPEPILGRKYDWNLALQDGAAVTGQPYTGDFEFIDTVSYWAVNHEVAPSGNGARPRRGC